MAILRLEDTEFVSFICHDCGHIWEENSKEGEKCPECGSENTEPISRTRY